jgi:predicted ATPase/DNA-binding SARP family transcriptional activator
MRFLVLGQLQTEENGETIPLGGQRQRAVLALLLLNAGQPVSRDRIVSEIWPDQTVARVRDSLYTYVSQLRKALGKDRIVRVDGGYRLDLTEVDAIDAVVFERAVKRASRLIGSDPEAAGHLIDLGLDLWRGRPYEGFEDLTSSAPETVRLDELRLVALEDRIDAKLGAGGTPVAGDVEKLCDEHPYRERLWGLLARTLYRSGRQAEALRTFTRLRAVLVEEMGLNLSPGLGRLEEQILLQDPALDPDAAPPPTNVPAPISSFVGRVREIALLDKAIHENRLVTVVGPGGAGKTRLAIEAAHNTRGNFRDGVWFVDLAQVAKPELVPQAVASALQTAERPGVDPAESIGEYLQPRTVLLVLDNCEHVVDTTATLALALLEMAPKLKVLATSRQALGREGEVRFTLEGLATAPVDEPFFEAERLFEARAAAVRGGFVLDETNRASVSSICQHLDGMPLAIELAAARSGVMSPPEIESHLVHRFALMTDQPSHRFVHRSLRASMDWSYDMLPTGGRQAFDALGVFEGPFSAASAMSVLGLDSDIETIDVVQSLVDASLLQTVSPVGGVSLYRMLETPRLFARDRLVESGERDVVVERHDSHYSNVCRRLRPAFFGRERVAGQHEVQSEMADHEAAFDRLVARGDISASLEMAWPLGHVWLFGGRLLDGERRLAALLDAATGLENRLRADALTVASFLAVYRQQFDQAIAWVDEAIGIYRLIAEEQGLAYALTRRGHVAFVSGDGPTAMAMLRESLDICQRTGYADGAAWPITLLAQARRWSGDESPEIKDMLEDGRSRFIAMGEIYGQVHADIILTTLYEEGDDFRRRYAEEMVRLGEQPGADRLVQSAGFHALAYVVWDAGELDRAEGLNRAAARSDLETGATVNTGLALLQSATFAGLRGQAERAAILFGAGDTHFAMQKAPFQDRMARPAIESATESLGPDRYRELYEWGTRLGVEDATALLLKQEASPLRTDLN